MRECVIGAFIVASLLGFSIMSYTGLWAFFAGFAIALYVFFFNSGPFPLSRKGFGEFTAFLFYGPVGVVLTYMVQAPVWEWKSIGPTMIISVAIGLMAAAVVLAHYFWTCNDDRTLQKDNLPAKYGKKIAGNVFLILGICACALLLYSTRRLPWWASCAPVAALAGHIAVWYKMRRLPQDKLQQAETWEMLILFALAIFICCCFTGIHERIDTMYFPE